MTMSSQIFVASSSRGGGCDQLLRDARQRQRNSEAKPFFQHELKVFQEKIDLHLRVEAMAHHKRAAHVDHLRGGGALFENFNQHARRQTRFCPEDERLCQRRSVEPDQQVCRKLRDRGHADIPQVVSFLCDRVEDRLACIGPPTVTRDKNRAVAPLDHRTGAAHRRVEKPKRLGGRGIAETASQIW